MTQAAAASLKGLKSIALDSGVTLSADLELPTTEQGDLKVVEKLAVCLHPWSWLGGQKNDPVLWVARQILAAKDYCLLRYNSRGVGGSTGWSSFSGLSEAQDLKDIIAWTLERLPSITTVVILGYSHGSLIASLQPVLELPVKTYHVLLSYPYGPRSWLTLFHSSTYSSSLRALVDDPRSNTLIVFGDRDEFTSQDNYKKWTETLSDPRGSLDIIEVKDATHFWSGRSERELAKILRTKLP